MEDDGGEAGEDEYIKECMESVYIQYLRRISETDELF